jgi:hypothetical protein
MCFGHASLLFSFSASEHKTEKGDKTGRRLKMLHIDRRMTTAKGDSDVK